jgi:hypothetical protein
MSPVLRQRLNTSDSLIQKKAKFFPRLYTKALSFPKLRPIHHSVCVSVCIYVPIAQVTMTRFILHDLSLLTLSSMLT